jgi:signal transduction histidine kinase
MGIDISDFNKASQQLRKLKEDEFEKRELTLAKGIGEIGQAVTQVGGEGTLALVTAKVFSAIAEAVSGVARCTIWIKDGTAADPKRYDDPHSISTIQVPFDEMGALELVLTSGQTIISDSARQSGAASRLRKFERRGRKRAFALLPLRGIHDRAPLGAIGVTLRGGALSDRDQARLETLAAFTGPLLAVAQELQRTREGEARRLRVTTKQQIFRSVLHTLGNDILTLSGKFEKVDEFHRRSDIPDDVHGLLLELRERTNLLNASLSDLRVHLESDDQQELVSVGDAVAEVVNPLRVTHLDIEFQVDVDPEHTVFMVRGWLHHILQNLVTNAAQVLMQAYRGGHVLVRSVRAGDDRVEIHIEDSGPGVDASITGSLFEKGVTQREGGTGEGLFIALDLAVSSGGDITLSPKPSPRLGGAHFCVELPARRDVA